MATGTYAPAVPQQYFDNSGNPLSAGTIQTYIAGTTTPLATYSDVALTVQNANPMTLDAGGRPQAGYIFLTPGLSYKFLIKDSTGATMATPDNILAIPPSSSTLDITGTAGETLTAQQGVYLSDGSGSKTAGQWFKWDSANTYSSTTPETGIVPSAIASGASGTIRTNGVMTGLSGLVVGTLYYAGTAGALTASAPTNKRLIGQADTTTSLVMSPNPPIGSLTVPQGGTGAVTLTSHGVLVGQGTSAIVATAAGTTGQVLTGVTGADPVFAAAVNQLTLLKQGSGTNASAVAAVVDSIAITGLTAKDTLLVYYTIESVTADTALTYLINTTDTAQLQTLCAAGGVVTAGSTFIGVSTIMPRQGSTTLIVGQNGGWGTLGAAAIAHGLRVTFATAWTGSWTLGLKHNGVTATGTFSYTWSVYKVAGQ